MRINLYDRIDLQIGHETIQQKCSNKYVKKQRTHTHTIVFSKQIRLTVTLFQYLLSIVNWFIQANMISFHIFIICFNGAAYKGFYSFTFCMWVNFAEQINFIEWFGIISHYQKKKNVNMNLKCLLVHNK